MGGKRKREEGRAGPASRTKPKVADVNPLHKGNATTTTVVITGTDEGSSGSSSSKQPPVDGTVKVELGPEVEADAEIIAHNDKPQPQELLEEHYFSTPVLVDPDIAIGDDEVKILQYPQDHDQLILQEEDEGDINSKEAEISHSSKAEGRLPFASSSKKRKVSVGTPELRNDTGAGPRPTGGEKNSGTNSKGSSDVNGISGLSEQTGSNPAEEQEAPLIIQNPQVAVPSQLITNEQEPLDQDSISPPTDTRTPKEKENAANRKSSPCCDVAAENSELKLRVDVLQKENEMLHKEVANLREGNNELAWFKDQFTDSDWDSELHLAAYDGTENAVKKLVKDGAYVNSRNKAMRTPLMCAASRNDQTAGLRIIKYLIENGADPYLVDNGNRTFLHNLVGVGDDGPLTPSQFHDIATFLVSKKLAKLFNTPGWSFGQLPLQHAVCEIDVKEETLSTLHESGVDFKVIDQDGDNLFCYALEGNRSSRLMIDLMFLGVDKRHLNKSQQNLLHKASEYCHVSGIKYFLTLGLDVNALDNFGNTPLHLVMLRGKGFVLGITKLLIENGASVEIKNADGRTPLNEAQRRDDIPDKDEVIRLLNCSEENSNVLVAPAVDFEHL